ncbi:MAG: type II secretion system F family protein [Armatimonadota bacterium]|nr:type II secretion system F family protein [bacterium]
MSLYRYEAVDNTGKVVRGVMDARDESQVAQKLSGMGYSARAVYAPGGQRPASSSATSVTAPRQSTSSVNAVPISVKSCVSAATLAIFFRQLATLVRSGRPLYQSLTDIRVSNRKIRDVLPVFQEKIRSGQKLSGAMAEYTGLFPVHATASVWYGELSGKLDIVLDEVATDFEREASDTRFGRIGWFITKVIFILFILNAPFLNFNKLLTAVWGQGLAAVGRYFAHGLMVALPVIIGLCIWWEVWGHIKRIPKVRLALDMAILKVPVWGKVHRYAAIARFFHVMDALMSAGIGADTAWDAASLTPRNSEIARRLRLARASAPANCGVVALLERARVFDLDDVGMAAAGEKSGKLPEAMLNISQSYEGRASAQKTVGKATSIALIMILNGVLTVLAVYLMASGYRDYLMPFLNAAGGM